MKLADKVLIVVYASIFVLAYIASNIVFEMTTDNFGVHDKLILYIVALLPTGYFSFKYIGPAKAQTYFATFFGGALLWVTVLYIVNKTELLYYAAQQQPVTTTLNISKVSKHYVKNSFEGSKIYVDYDNQHLELLSSRTNYFAFQNKTSFKADIGKAGNGNYYVSKIYWQPGQLQAARGAYWHYWVYSVRYVPLFMLGILIVVLIVLYLKKNTDALTPKPAAPHQFWKIMLVVMGIVFTLFLLAYAALAAYLYFKYGHIG